MTNTRPVSLLSLVLVSCSAAGCASSGGQQAVDTPGRTSRSLFGSKGGPWTIRCIELTGELRTQNITQLAETLRRTPGIRSRDVYVFDTGNGRTGLYYGRYYRKTNPETGKRDTPPQMRADLNLIKQLGDENGRRFFLQALPARVPTRAGGGGLLQAASREGI